MAHFSTDRNDRLLEELNRHEQQLNIWLDSAPANAILFLEDPVAALRAANLGISENMLEELQQTMEAIARKLQPINRVSQTCRKPVRANSAVQSHFTIPAKKSPAP
jgi:hypothetical protein